MTTSRLHLFHCDLVRELCDRCGIERFHFIAVGANPPAEPCGGCGTARRVVDLTDTSIIRLVTGANGELVVVNDCAAPQERIA